MFKKEDIKDKRVLLRCDLDLPIKDGRVENTYRLECLLPTLKVCLENAKQICLIGHLGRPKGNNPDLSLAPVREELKRLVNQEINFISSGFSPGDWWKGESPLSIIENLRFDPREESKDRGFASELSEGADVYIYDAFASYNSSTSLDVLPTILPTFTGFQFDKEVDALDEVLETPKHPTLLLASGAKMDKLEVIHKISAKFDNVLLGGKFAPQEMLTPDGLDLSDEATSLFIKFIAQANTIVMNGPLGMYEDGIHDKATRAVLGALKASPARTILGGGDTLAAIPHLGFAYTDYGFVSTGGGAMLEFLATGTHPLLQITK